MPKHGVPQSRTYQNRETSPVFKAIGCLFSFSYAYGTVIKFSQRLTKVGYRATQTTAIHIKAFIKKVSRPLVHYTESMHTHTHTHPSSSYTNPNKVGHLLSPDRHQPFSFFSKSLSAATADWLHNQKARGVSTIVTRHA